MADSSRARADALAYRDKSQQSSACVEECEDEAFLQWRAVNEHRLATVRIQHGPWSSIDSGRNHGY
jgi:hypothetical protein